MTFIIERAKERCAAGRENPTLRKDDAYVVDLIFLLEEAVKLNDAMAQRASVMPPGDEVLTIGKMQAIMEKIENPHLQRYFQDMMREALGLENPHQQPRIQG